MALSLESVRRNHIIVSFSSKPATGAQVGVHGGQDACAPMQLAGKHKNFAT